MLTEDESSVQESDTQKNDKNIEEAEAVKSNTTQNEVQQEEEEDDDDDDDTEIMSNQMSPISQNSPISVSGYSHSPYTLLNTITNDRNLVSLEELEQRVKQKIHSRKFRE